MTLTADLAFCIHGHFYQPPRANPLTGDVPVEPGASPYRNWNERIHAHCYRPNAQLGNFGKISFNLGPTLLDWMGLHDPATLEIIVRQDQYNVAKHGVGNAMAQAFNHTILPLATREEKVTQVLWGIADFEHRFGRKPQGMWLPETAVNEETLSVLAECGIEFTLLAPWQANTTDLDPSRPYTVHLPQGRKISVFFYNQDLSTRISFDPGATSNADRFILESVMPKFRLVKGRALEPQLVLVASDGELYGHHQAFRDKFLAHLLEGALDPFPIQRTYPALWLRDHPPAHAITIRENTSWSCHHGVTRWAGSCGCTGHGEWKAPLRAALTKIARAVDQVYTEVIQEYGGDPVAMRNLFIRVALQEVPAEEFLFDQLRRRLTREEVNSLTTLLWAQFERQRIFTSCGWFFDDFDRIEPRNNVAYAAQAVWLTYRATRANLVTQSVEGLKRVVSPRTHLRADQVFLKHLQSASKK